MKRAVSAPAQPEDWTWTRSPKTILVIMAHLHTSQPVSIAMRQTLEGSLLLTPHVEVHFPPCTHVSPDCLAMAAHEALTLPNTCVEPPSLKAGKHAYKIERRMLSK